MVYRCFCRLRFLCPACFKLDSADTAFGYLYRLAGEKAAAEMVCEKERVKFLAVVILVLLIVRLKWQQLFCMLYAISQFVYSKEL